MKQSRLGRFFRKLGKWSLILIVVAAVGAVIAHFAWTYTGSNEPQLVHDDNGIKVYTIKTPGRSLLTVVAKRRVDTTMDKAVSAMIDDTLENCADWNPRCYGSEAVKPWDPKTMSYVQLWTQRVGPSFVTPRQYLLGVQLSQNPSNKAVTVQFHERNDLLPPNDCCVRVPHFRNRWIFTPVDHDTIDVELLIDTDVGLPYFLFNKNAPNGAYWIFDDLPRLFNSPRYTNAKLDWLLTNQTTKTQ